MNNTPINIPIYYNIYNLTKIYKNLQKLTKLDKT